MELFAIQIHGPQKSLALTTAWQSLPDLIVLLTLSNDTA